MSGKGIDINGLSINWADLMRHKHGFTDPVPQNIEHDLAANGVTTLHGTATFTTPNQLAIDGDTYEILTLPDRDRRPPKTHGI